METAGLSFSICFVVMLLLQVVTEASAQFTVSAPEGPIVAPLGGVVELSCQLSPPQSAGHMEVRWFRDRYTQPVHLYKGGKDLYGETLSEYVERTEFLKEAIGEGKVTLRILNVSVYDDGQYHCFFKDGNFYDEAITTLKVTATNFETQIFVHHSNTKGTIMECVSGGWFPQPLMEWRDDRGEIIPPESTSHSQDNAKLFNMKMTLLLKQKSHGIVTCYLQNPITGHEERTSIVLSDDLFNMGHNYLAILLTILCVLFLFAAMYTLTLNDRTKGLQTFCMQFLNSLGAQFLLLGICSAKIFVYLPFRKRVTISDPLFPLYNNWMSDMAEMMGILMAFFTLLIIILYWTLKGYTRSRTSNQQNTEIERLDLKMDKTKQFSIFDKHFSS